MTIVSRLVVLALVAASAAAVTPRADAVPSTRVMISEVYGGGGNSGATYTHDFVELTNTGADQNLIGWSVQYLPGAPTENSLWQVTTLIGSATTGDAYLVQEAAGAGGTTTLPTPDDTGGIPMSATTGTVALVNTADALTCKTAAACAADPRIVDLVGYGDAVVREGSPVPGASNTASVARHASPVDTDANSVDFAAADPTPGALPTPTPLLPIHDLQGTTHLSPYDGASVATTGIVTAIRGFGSARGFWMQTPAPDADPATSEGIFVFTGSTPGVQVGDSVRVDGTVDEFYPDGSPATALSLSTTELVTPTVLVSSTGNPLPTPELLTPTTVPAAFAPQPGGSIETLGLQPSTYAMDFYESREAMRVRVTDARVVGPTTSFNELFVTTKPSEHVTARGGTLYGGYDQQNSGRLLVESLIPFAQQPFPQVDVGDVLAGDTVGPVDYSRFGGYRVLATQLGAEQDGGLQRETTRAQRDGELSVATYNVENLDPGDSPAKFAELAAGIVNNLRSPDIVALEEIQDNSGPTNDGVVAADQTLAEFTAAIVAAGGPAYDWRQVDPVNNADGGEPGGNIRVVFLFDPERVDFVDRPGGDATTAVDVAVGAGGKPRLSVSPGRINPASTAWTGSRKPLVGEFRFRKKTVLVVANHFSSKGGDQPLAGRHQPPSRSSETQRLLQAAEVRAFVDDVRAISSTANVVVLGDLNDFEFSPTLATLTNGGALTDLVTTLPVDQRYNYVFQGNSQTLDHILVRGRMRAVDYDIVHINAEFHDQTSDHDPQITRFTPAK